VAKLSVDKALLKAKSYAKKGDAKEATRLFQVVLKAFPKNKRAQQGLEALNKSMQSITTQDPPKEAINQLLDLYSQRQLQQALEQAKILLQLFPSSSVLHNICGAVYKDLSQLDASVKAYKKALFINPDYTDVYYNMGIALKAQGKLEDAIKAYNKALSIKPNYADAYNNMGNALQEQGKLEEAIEAYNKAISIKLDYVDAFYNMGNALKVQGKFDEAIVFYNKVLAINPDYIGAYNNLGIALKEQDKLEEAINAYNKALAIKPDYAEACNNMGNALQEQGKLEEAIEAYNKALSIKPEYAVAYHHMGNALQEQRKLEEAVEAYNKALAIKPDYADAYFSLSYIHNLMGELQKGLKLHEWRLKLQESPTKHPREDLRWNGTKTLTGKSFLVYEEQGLGDIIQFCRYLPLLEQRGACVIFKVNPMLHALLRTMNCQIHLKDCISNDNEIAFEAPLMSLPHLFDTNLETIPTMSPYLFADPKKVTYWGKKLCKKSFKIGICWQGSKNKADFGRSFPLSLFKSIAGLPNVELISLHKGEGEDQIKDNSFSLVNLGVKLDNGEDAFLDTAAVMMNCDLIITSDTAVAHLAGALGCKTWVALKYIPDWRWMLDRNDSPWYPSIRLYRQKKQGDWVSVFNIIKQDLFLLLNKGV
jgi:tetratricopeptide (TPR) repeat protein